MEKKASSTKMEENESVIIGGSSRSRLKASRNPSFRRQNVIFLQGISFKTLAFVIIASNTIQLAFGIISNAPNKMNNMYSSSMNFDTSNINNNNNNEPDYVYDPMDKFKRIFQNVTINTPIDKSNQITNNPINDNGNDSEYGSDSDNATTHLMMITSISSTSNPNQTTIASDYDVDTTLSSMINDQNNYWALSALFLVLGTAAGNILVCLAITWERRLQNVTNYFLMSLAITDLMVAILVMPLGILTLYKGELFFFVLDFFCFCFQLQCNAKAKREGHVSFFCLQLNFDILNIDLVVIRIQSDVLMSGC